MLTKSAIATLTCSSNRSFRRCVCSSSRSTYSLSSSISSFTCCTVSSSCFIATISRFTCGGEKTHDTALAWNTPCQHGERRAITVPRKLLSGSSPPIWWAPEAGSVSRRGRPSSRDDGHPAADRPASPTDSYSSRWLASAVCRCRVSMEVRWDDGGMDGKMKMHTY